jgi:hypothetical protein
VLITEWGFVFVKERRLEQDKQEGIIADQKRREIVERAERLLFERTERVKALRSAMLDSEVLKVTLHHRSDLFSSEKKNSLVQEREAQIDLKKRIEEAKAARDNEHFLQQLAQLKLAEEEQIRKEEAAKERAHALAATQKEQLMDARERYRRQVEEQFEVRVAVWRPGCISPVVCVCARSAGGRHDPAQGG